MTKIFFNTKVWLLTLAIAFISLFVGFELAGRLGLFWGLVLGVSFHILVVFKGDSNLIDHFKATLIRGQDPDSLNQIRDEACQKLKVSPPQIYMMDIPTATAFTCFSGFSGPRICLSRNLVRALNHDELKALVAWQVCHLQHWNRFVFNSAHNLSQSIASLGLMLDRTFFLNSTGFRFSKVFAIISHIILRCFVTSRVYFESDRLAATLISDRRNLSEVLWKMENFSQVRPVEVLPPCSSHYFIVSPLRKKTSSFLTSALRHNLLLAHPKIDQRIKRLIGYFPI